MTRTVGVTLVVLLGLLAAAAAAPGYLEDHPAARVSPGAWARAGLLLGAALAAAWVIVRARRRYGGAGGLAALSALAVLGLATLWRAYPETSSSGLAVLCAALAAVGLHAACITALGARLLGLLRIRGCTRLLYGLVAFLVGWVAWGWGAFLLGLGGGFGAGALVGLTVLAGVAGRRELVGCLRRWWRSRTPTLGSDAAGIAMLAALLGFAAVAGFLGPTRAASPPVAFDELMYHVAAPRHYLDAGEIDFVPDIRGSYMPALSHMHYALFLALRIDFGAKLVNLAMSLVLLLLAFEAGRAWGSRLAGAAAGIVLALTPLTAWEAGTAYLDNALAALGLGCAVLLLRGIQRRRRSWVVVAGALAGGALFTKYQAIPLVAILALLGGFALAASRRRWRGPLAGAVALSLGLALLVPLPHWSRNLWHTGNPIFPLMDQVFSTTTWFEAEDLAYFNGTNFEMWGFGRDGTSLLLAPWRLVLDEGRFHGHAQQALGLVWLMLLPAAAVGGLRRARALPLGLAGLLVFCGWFFTMQVGRYLLPALALGAVLAGLGIAWLAGRRSVAALGVVAPLALASAVLQAPDALSTEDDLALAGEGRERFLELRLPSYRALRMVIATAPEDALVWAFMDQGAAYYYPRRVLGDWFGPYKYSRIAASIVPFAFRPGEEVVQQLRSWGVTHVLLNLPASPRYRAADIDLEALLAPSDPVLAAHLEPLYGDRGVLVYAFDPTPAVTPGLDPGAGANRLSNPSFETALDAVGGGWGVVGAPAVVPEPLGAPDGELVLRSDVDNYAYQYFTARPGAWFLAGSQVRADGRDAAPLRLQVLWLDAGGEVVDSSIAVRTAAADGYRSVSAIFTAPPGAARGIFHVLGHEAGRVRFDDVTLREVGPAAAEAADGATPALP